ncbi:MAG TPA: hypothetical protein VJS44_20245 [Pyrinomonadaceae bacterium]|nr:hypothetical protein [Pyrinomonadaceae bacterium]
MLTLPPAAPKAELLNETAGALELKELNYYYDGAKWVKAWFQCEMNRNVAIFEEETELRYFSKRQPTQAARLSIKQTEEPDCGMMKCYYHYSVQGGGRVVVMESNYKDEEAYWTTNHTVSIERGRLRLANEAACHWFERTRLAVITSARSIYVTESEKGALEYSSFNFAQASSRPSVRLTNGARTSDEAKEIETFAFKNTGYEYVLNVSTNEAKPSVEVLVKKNGALVQRENCLSYTYLKKS